MEETRRRQRRDENAWRAVMLRFEQSDLSVSQFCEHEGIGVASFYQWRSRLGTSGSRRTKQAPLERSTPSPRSDFLDLGTLGSGTSRMDVRVELGGVVLHLTRS